MVNLFFDCSVDRGDLARHRLRAAARRDRPLGRLDERRRLGAARRALGEPGRAAPRRHRRRARARRLRRRDLRAAAHPARACRASSRPSRACSRCSGCSSTCSAPTGSINLPYDSAIVSFGQLLVMPAWLSHGLALIPGIVMLVVGLRTMEQRRERQPLAGLARRADRQGGGADRRAAVRRLLSQHRPRRAVDVRPLRAARRRHAVRLHPHQVGPVDDGGRRQRRGGAARRHQRARHLHQRLHALLDVRGARRRARRRRGSPRRASRPAPATSTSTPSPRR